ncbi:MAG: hypothetical protein ACYCX3_08230 [Thermoleophilia bacterium]
MAHRAARILSTLFQPILTGTYVLLVVSVATATGWPEALAWGLGTAALTAGIPTLDILRRIRGHTVSDFHIVAREQRLRPLLVMLVCVAVALGLAVGLGAPEPLRVALVAALAAGAALTAITRVWKISFHTATATSAVALLTWVLGPGALALVPLLPAVAWSRVKLGRHSTAQVVAGGAISLVVTLGVLGAS